MFHFSYCLSSLSTPCMPENPDTNSPLCDANFWFNFYVFNLSFSSLLRKISSYYHSQGNLFAFIGQYINPETWEPSVWYSHGSVPKDPKQSLMLGHQIPLAIPPEVVSSLSLTLFFMYTVKSLPVCGSWTMNEAPVVSFHRTLLKHPTHQPLCGIRAKAHTISSCYYESGSCSRPPAPSPISFSPPFTPHNIHLKAAKMAWNFIKNSTLVIGCVLHELHIVTFLHLTGNKFLLLRGKLAPKCLSVYTKQWIKGTNKSFLFR